MDNEVVEHEVVAIDGGHERIDRVPDTAVDDANDRTWEDDRDDQARDPGQTLQLSVDRPE